MNYDGNGLSLILATALVAKQEIKQYLNISTAIE